MKKLFLGLSIFIFVFYTYVRASPDLENTDVVVIVDTSESMKQIGMDPERTSLLVSKLLSDIVPGKLSIVRLMDLHMDKDKLPSRDTGEKVSCKEIQGTQCTRVEPEGDWMKKAKEGRYGSLERPTIGDNAFKKRLDAHLLQESGNSLFELSFAAADGIFSSHQMAGGNQVVIWLSDGRTNDEGKVKRIIANLKRQGVRIEAIVFGKGDITLAKSVDVPVQRTSNPAELMKAFAAVFRRTINAPFEIDNQVSVQPEFTMHEHIEKAWVVVYGDDSLRLASLTAPDGSHIRVDFAKDNRAGSGAYRVALLEQPTAGKWRVTNEGGGNGIAYAVVQYSGLIPEFVSPSSAVSGIPINLVVAVKANESGKRIDEVKQLSDVSLFAKIDGKRHKLLDNGRDGDDVAGDGMYSATVTFAQNGDIPVKIHLKSPVADKEIQEVVKVSGSFRYTTGEPLTVDFGVLAVKQVRCRLLDFNAEHTGEVPFHLNIKESIPSGHELYLKLNNGKTTQKSEELLLSPHDSVQLCLESAKDAPSSKKTAVPLASLQVVGASSIDKTLELIVSWQVNGLSFWQRWLWLIKLLLGLAMLVFVILGFVLPHRFNASLSLSMGESEDELGEYQPMPIKQWAGTGAGFYRNAKAYIHPDYQVSGKSDGAAVLLEAVKGGFCISPASGYSLQWQNPNAEWDVVENEHLYHINKILRVGSSGPYFRLTNQWRT